MGRYSNDTVLWRKGTEILTAGINRVSLDKRISILHDECKFNIFFMFVENFPVSRLVGETI